MFSIDHEQISTAIPFPLIQEGQLSVAGESMCTIKVLVNRLKGKSLPRDSVNRLTDRLDMLLIVLTGP